MKSPIILATMLAAVLLSGCNKSEDEPEVTAKDNDIVYAGNLKKVEYAYYSVKTEEGIDFYNLRLGDSPEEDLHSSDPVYVTDEELQPTVVDIFISNNLLGQSLDLTRDLSEGTSMNYWDCDVKLVWNNFKTLQSISSLRPEKLEIVDHEWDYTPIFVQYNIESGTMKVSKDGNTFTAEITAVTKEGRNFTFKYSGQPIEKEDKR